MVSYKLPRTGVVFYINQKDYSKNFFAQQTTDERFTPSHDE